MTYATFKILQLVLVFGGIIGFIAWDMLRTEKALKASDQANAERKAS